MIEMHDSTRRGARRLRRLTQAAMALLALGTIGVAAIQLAGPPRTGPAIVHVDAGGLAPVPGAIFFVLVGLLLGLALRRLARMLHRVELGAPFTGGGDLRGFALWLFLSVLAAILVPPLLQLAEVAATRSGRITFSLEGGQLLMLLVTGLLFLVARLLDEAQRVADDASQIV
jgi:hypothetical protein